MRSYQTVPKQQKYTAKQFDMEFPSEDACLEYVMQRRWPNGLALCVRCKAERKHYRVTGRTAYACMGCGNHIFPLAGTIFHKSSTPLRTWFYVIRLMTSTRVGVSAKHIQRETGVTYKCAWRMMKQVRLLMADRIGLQGPVEMDEAYFDARKTDAKATVFGIVERGGRVIARVVPDAKQSTILPIVGEVLPPKTMIYTDDHATYDGLRWMGQSHKHAVVNHSKGYVDGYAHTNTVDGFWSLVKRGIKGVYYQVGMEYLQSYLNEYTFRYNRRKVMYPMFRLLAERTTTQVCPCAREAKLLAKPE
ncbi:MAG: IS1595 family transposase [Terracidiphilus sp.]